MDIYSKQEVRAEVLDKMEAIVNRLTPTFQEQLVELLPVEEKTIFTEFAKMGYDEGAWYRPIHNVVVPLAMSAIADFHKLDRRILMPAAICHDVGNSEMKIAKGKGSEWENADKRIIHRTIGAKLVHERLTALTSQDKITYSTSMIDEICDIILRHDDPYMGIPLTREKDLQHRDADRVFVPSVVSWYKDFLNYKDDINNEFRKNLEPDTFLSMRLAFFYRNSSENPVEIHSPLYTDLTRYNEGGKVEPQYTATGKTIIDNMLIARVMETREGIPHLDPENFIKSFETMFHKEMSYLSRMAQKGRNQ